MNALVEPETTLPRNAQQAYKFDAPIAKKKHDFETIAVIGLGYVGLPLAVRLAEKFVNVTGLDSAQSRVHDLCRGIDITHEVSRAALVGSTLDVTTQPSDIKNATFYIVAVPTPITAAKQPDFAPLDSACRTIAPHLSKGDVVVFESTVYPGVTEDYCGKALERLSGYRAGIDFHLGYSPERINPGDKVNTIETIIKIVSGDTPQTLDRVAAVYEAVIDAGIYRAASIKVAEGAKVLENTQRDVNIALMNEVSKICDKVGIATEDVINAASTKWNFMPFTPGLVGGHCIGVDPYYLAALAETVGMRPELILAGRRINDSMVDHVTTSAMRLLLQQGDDTLAKRIAIYGITFKEDVPDTRNSKVVDVVRGLQAYGFAPLVHDLHCSQRDADALGIPLCDPDATAQVDLMLLASPHREYAADPTLLDRIKPGGVLMDLRGAFFDASKPKELVYWSL